MVNVIIISLRHISELTLNNNGMASSIEENSIDGTSLDVRVEHSLLTVVK